MLWRYLENSSLHGMHFIANSKLHWTERVFWIISVIGAWTCSILLMLSSYSQFQNSAISFTTDTAYLDWTTKFPAIIICEKEKKDIAPIIHSIIGHYVENDIEKLVNNIAFFRGSFSAKIPAICSELIQKEKNCNTENYTVIANAVRSSCDFIFKDCIWNSESFECCRYFREIKSVYGTCYAFNSEANSSNKDFVISRKINRGLAELTIETTTNSLMIFAKSPEEVPNYNDGPTVLFDSVNFDGILPYQFNEAFVSVKETINDKDVYTVDVERRGCRYVQENYLNFSNIYSHSACMIKCLVELQKQECNCNHHLMPGIRTDDICDFNGLMCLSRAFHQLKARSARCNCESCCTEMEINIIGNIKKDKYKFFHPDATNKFAIQIQAPTLRYIRKVVNGNLDLIVSMGGTAGLFVGASVLSIIEFFYYILIRPITDRINKNRPRLRKINLTVQKLHFRQPYPKKPFSYID